MKLAILILAAVFLYASPASAGHYCRTVTTGGDKPNHQSSLSSTTEGGNQTQVCCD